MKYQLWKVQIALGKVVNLTLNIWLKCFAIQIQLPVSAPSRPQSWVASALQMLHLRFATAFRLNSSALFCSSSSFYSAVHYDAETSSDVWQKVAFKVLTARLLESNPSATAQSVSSTLSPNESPPLHPPYGFESTADRIMWWLVFVDDKQALVSERLMCGQIVHSLARVMTTPQPLCCSNCFLFFLWETSLPLSHHFFPVPLQKASAGGSSNIPLPVPADTFALAIYHSSRNVCPISGAI